MKEFEEIQHPGGKISFGKNGLGVSHCNLNAFKMYILCFSYNGIPLGYADLRGGYGAPINMPQPSIPVTMICDQEGFFGMRCPSCEQYFRVTFRRDTMYCPYCGEWHYGYDFLTDNQRQYVKAYIQAFITAINKEENIEIDLDSIIDSLSDNISPFVYTEQRQQKRVECTCGVIYDILGEYGGCPLCNKRNSLYVLNQQLAMLEERVDNPIFPKEEREKREQEWIDILKNCVSGFEALGNDLRQQFLQLPATPQRKNDIRNMSFQTIIVANNKLKSWYGIDFLSGILEEDKAFIIRSFGRRHLFTHNAGVVDQEYLDNTLDTSVRLRERVHVRSKDVKRLIALIRKVGQQLFNGFESIS